MDKKTSQFDVDVYRSNLNRYTQKAFNMLPELRMPCILDMGCGSGVPTIELARLSNGLIVGFDIDQSQLNKLRRKLVDEGLGHRTGIVKGSMFELCFSDASFDIIWAEGSIAAVGFKRGLMEWRRLLKPNGYIVAHDDMKDINMKLACIADCGYKLDAYFNLSEDVWWREYYGPLEKQIIKLRDKSIDDPEAIADIEKSQREIDNYKKNPQLFRSCFMIIKKI
jgi:ubiquinone/menaquinone biosynthesis C-methylase UbiE